MKCDLASMLRQARNAIDPDRDDFGYAFSLEQLEQHVRQVRDGTATLDQFADFYMIRPEPLKALKARWPADVIVNPRLSRPQAPALPRAAVPGGWHQ